VEEGWAVTDLSGWTEIGLTTDGGDYRGQCPTHGDTLGHDGTDEFGLQQFTCFYPGCHYQEWTVDA
jgi:hypothetical protein